jgi:hypothetical protein
LSGFRPAEYSNWKINQNKFSPAWEKTLPGAKNRGTEPLSSIEQAEGNE